MREALVRECARYDLDYDRVVQCYAGEGPATTIEGRAWWDYAILSAAVGVFVWLGMNARVPELAMNFVWVGVLVAILAVSAVGCRGCFGRRRASPDLFRNLAGFSAVSLRFDLARAFTDG